MGRTPIFARDFEYACKLLAIAGRMARLARRVWWNSVPRDGRDLIEELDTAAREYHARRRLLGWCRKHRQGYELDCRRCVWCERERRRKAARKK